MVKFATRDWFIYLFIYCKLSLSHLQICVKFSCWLFESLLWAFRVKVGLVFSHLAYESHLLMQPVNNIVYTTYGWYNVWVGHSDLIRIKNFASQRLSNFVVSAVSIPLLTIMAPPSFSVSSWLIWEQIIPCWPIMSRYYEILVLNKNNLGSRFSILWRFHCVRS